jgi:hypothetical protein
MRINLLKIIILMEYIATPEFYKNIIINFFKKIILVKFIAIT